VAYRLNIFAAPAAVLALLAGMVTESWANRVVPADAEAYHRAAKVAVNSIPTRVGSFSARVEPTPAAAIALLKPNVIRCLKYADSDSTKPRYQDRWASLLVDQCYDARDMNGHWPPNCYVNSGQELTYTQPRDWVVDGLLITGTEYHFRQVTATSSTRTAVYNFLIVPGQGILRDMPGVRRAAEDYRQRFFGAAQFQLVMDADLSLADRDGIFTTLMEPCVPVIRQLMTR
jgi:hypothetical protein